MKILIDMPEETYNKMRRGEALYSADANVAIFAIETGTPLEECEDAISRQAVIDMTGLSEWFDSSDSYNKFVSALSELPSVKPQYTDAEIQKMQDFEFAEIQKAYEVGKAEAGAEILDKIRAEIEDLDRFYDNDYFSGNRDSMFKCNEVMQIIDRYKASPTEAEGSE